MEKERIDRGAAVLGWSALLAWWGVSILFDPISLGISGIGTGLIMLGVNLARLASGVRPRRTTTEVGAMALIWGSIDVALELGFWASVSVALLAAAAVCAASFMLPRRDEGVGDSRAA
jgi:hypothetical protein